MLRKSLHLILAVPLVFFSIFSFAQEGSRADLRADEERLRQEEFRLHRDRDRLYLDRRNHAPRYVIRGDEAQIRQDRSRIRALRADIKRDRQIRRHRRRY
ncbi:MAG TPA: hypothetical protein VFR84_06670 [Candidatus Angelobacter sp.]|nr:hypothetical protein [Candidatus Angelobacter sp.]